MNAMVNLSPLSVGISPEFMRRKAPELAKDIVTRIAGAKELATSFYGLTDSQWEVLKNWESFRELIKVASEELSGPLGMAERIRRQCRYGLAEGGIADMFGVLSDAKTGPQHKIKVVEVAAEIAGITGKTTGAVTAAGGGGGPLVQIIMPDGRQLSVGVSQPAIEGQATVIKATE